MLRSTLYVQNTDDCIVIVAQTEYTSLSVVCSIYHTQAGTTLMASPVVHLQADEFKANFKANALTKLKPNCLWQDITDCEQKRQQYRYTCKGDYHASLCS